MTHHDCEERTSIPERKQLGSLYSKRRLKACLRSPRHHKDLYQAHIFKRLLMASTVSLARSLNPTFDLALSHHKMDPKGKARRSPSKSNRPDR